MANEKTTTLAPAAETQPKPNQTKPKRRAKPAGPGKEGREKGIGGARFQEETGEKDVFPGKGKISFRSAIQRRPSPREGRGAKAIRKDGKDQPVRIYFLGGLNEIGKNMTLYECGDDMFIVDCGLAFPDEDMLGVDLVIPDFTFVERNKNKIRGILLTHGHEDHIGSPALPAQEVQRPPLRHPADSGPGGGQTARARAFEQNQAQRLRTRAGGQTGLLFH